MFELAGLAIGKSLLDSPAETAAKSLDLFTWCKDTKSR